MSLGKLRLPSGAVALPVAAALAATGAALAAEALAGTVAPARMEAPPPAVAAGGPVGRIYFTDEGRGQIMSVRPDGRDRRNLTARHRGRRSAHFPSPSPDGRHVVFSRYPGRRGWRAGQRGDLMVMRADGRRPRALTRTPTVDERTPAFTANGRGVLYGLEVGEGRYEIARRGLRAQRGLRVTNLDRGITEDPVPALDGSRIAFQTLDATRLMLARPDGGGLVELTERMNASCPDDCPLEEDPAFSPDSRMLAFATTRSGSREVWTAQADGSGARQLTRVGDAVEPWWSPDGRYIVFERLGQGIWIIGEDGGGLRRVVASARATFPRWGR